MHSETVSSKHRVTVAYCDSLPLQPQTPQHTHCYNSPAASQPAPTISNIHHSNANQYHSLNSTSLKCVVCACCTTHSTEQYNHLDWDQVIGRHCYNDSVHHTQCHVCVSSSNSALSALHIESTRPSNVHLTSHVFALQETGQHGHGGWSS